jgi:hypothetical protein
MSMRGSVRATVSAAAVAAVAFAGCGGDDGGDELSQADFEREAEAVCTRADEETREIFREADLEDDDVLDDVAGRYADLLRSSADELRDVGYPEGKQDEANEFYDQMDALADRVDDDPAVFRAEEEPEEFSDLDTLAEEIGLADCGE